MKLAHLVSPKPKKIILARFLINQLLLNIARLRNDKCAVLHALFFTAAVRQPAPLLNMGPNSGMGWWQAGAAKGAQPHPGVPGSWGSSPNLCVSCAIPQLTSWASLSAGSGVLRLGFTFEVPKNEKQTNKQVTPLKHGFLLKFVVFNKDLFPSFSFNMIVVSMIEHVLRACSR